MSERVRIHKALADAGVASRRRSEQLVVDGRVAVNGSTASVGQLVDPATDVLTVDGTAIAIASGPRLYLLLAKPAGVTSTVTDRHAERTVIDLVPQGLRGNARLYPVGRLDRDSEGLLMLTNDGGWAQRMLHPRHGIEREYAIGLAGELDASQKSQLEGGIALDEGMARLTALRRATGVEQKRLLALAGATHGLVWYYATLGQGMKRQLRRMFAAVGAPVQRLVRVRIGTLRLDDLAVGAVRPLTTAERERLASSRQRP